MIIFLFSVCVMKILFRSTLVFGILCMASQVSEAQKVEENFDLFTKSEKIFVQQAPEHYLVFLDRPNTLSQRNKQELMKENNYYIPTKKLQKDFGFKAPTYYPSYYLNYQVRIKTFPPKLLKIVKGSN